MSTRLDPRSKKAIQKFEGLNKLTRFAVERASFFSGRDLVKNTSNEILKKNKRGKLYMIKTKSGRTRRHRASAPEQTHANITGATRRSLSFKVQGYELEFGYGVDKGDATEQAEFLENGTSKMEARPSLFNGIKSSRKQIANNLEREIGRSLL